MASGKTIRLPITLARARWKRSALPPASSGKARAANVSHRTRPAGSPPHGASVCEATRPAIAISAKNHGDENSPPGQKAAERPRRNRQPAQRAHQPLPPDILRHAARNQQQAHEDHAGRMWRRSSASGWRPGRLLQRFERHHGWFRYLCRLCARWLKATLTEAISESGGLHLVQGAKLRPANCCA